MSETRKLAAILALDVVGYSRLAGADEDRTLARLRSLRSDVLDPSFSVNRGRVVKRTGDGALVEFRSVVDAVRCALEVQHDMAERNGGVPPDRRIQLRIGIHVGDVVEESDGDLMGDGVNIAARLEGIAEPGAICLSEDAYRQVRSRLDLSVSDLGDATLKNIAEPVRVFSVAVGGEPSAAPRGSAATPAVAVAGAAPAGKPRLAVLPFANMSGDAEQDYFADGIAEDIITALSKLSQIAVIARNSSFTFKGRAASAQEVGRGLGASHVLEGSVRKAGNRVRVTAQLAVAAQGLQLWADRFDRELTDIFAVQDDVTQQIVAALALKLTDSDRQRIGAETTDNIEAYNCFLRGRDLFLQEVRAANGAARELLQQATTLDPGFAPAHAFLGAAHILDFVNGWSPSPETSRELAAAAARRAVELDPGYPYGLWALAGYHLWRRELDDAIGAAQRAIAANPSFADGFIMLGLGLHYAGRGPEALASIEHAISLDPMHRHMWLHFHAQCLHQVGRHAEAVVVARRRIVRNPETDATRALLASSLGHLGRAEEARQAWQALREVNPAYSIDQRRQVLPYRDPADFERIVEGLTKAGITP